MKEGKKVTLYFPAPIWDLIIRAKKQTPFASPSRLIQDAIAARYGGKAGKGVVRNAKPLKRANKKRTREISRQL